MMRGDAVRSPSDSDSMSSEFLFIQHLISCLGPLNFKTTAPISPQISWELPDMNYKTEAPDDEFEAIRTVYTALEALDSGARTRVMNYIISRLNVTPESKPEDGTADTREGQGVADSPDTAALRQEQSRAPKYASFAELFDAARPSGNANKALVAGYWLQVCQDQGDFDGLSANRELKHLGQGVDNITIAMNSLKVQKPALVIQLKKSGKSQQARKTYKVTVGGIKTVEAMINV
jgi:hypothetical protein